MSAKKRKGISKKVRFEVFKRDSFTCQYCGKTAPDVILELDHIKPVAKGGDNDILNLVTACRDCNGGKRDTELSDDTAIQKQRAQLEELNERREQLEMMLKWREGMKSITDDVVEVACDAFHDATTYRPTEKKGARDLRVLIRKYGLADVLEAIDIATEKYLKFVSDEPQPTQESAELAFSKISGICYGKSQPDYMKDLFYIRGIVRNRMTCIDWRAIKLLKDAYAEGRGIAMDDLRELAKSARNWTEWKHDMECLIESLEEDNG